MDDLISRQALLKRLKRHQYWWEINENYGIESIIEKLPSAQQKIIRCKDCVKADLCAWRREGAEFCSYAERKGEQP